MKLRSLACAAIGVGSLTAAAAAGVDTTDPTVIAAFQSGLTVQTFESLAGRTPQAITAYTSGVAVSPTAFVFNQVPGVQFSVGGAVGTNMPALYQLGGAIAGDAHSASTVLGPVDFEFNTNFSSSAFIEVFFPVKVSSVGFWLNPALGNVTLIATDTNFAFSGLPETNLETFAGTAGRFAGISRPTADIGGFKILSSGGAGFTIDDFSYGVAGTTTPIPEPAEWALLLGGAAALGAWRRRGPQRRA
jgi:MYXO-CTERM domain-containing protein